MNNLDFPPLGLQLIEQAQTQGNLKVTCVGAGYVGALTAITMAVKNPSVQFIVCDINQSLIDKWNQGTDFPFYEPQLDEYHRRATKETRNITFTTDVNFAMRSGHIIIIAVNTPARHSDDQMKGMGVPTNLDAFFSVVSAIAANLHV